MSLSDTSIILIINGKNAGPYSVDQVKAMVNRQEVGRRTA